MAAVLAREWGTPDDVSIIGAHDWISLDGKTEASLSYYDDYKTPEADYVVRLRIYEPECTRRASSGAGV